MSGSHLKTLWFKMDQILETYAEDGLDLISSPEKIEHSRRICCPGRVTGRMDPCCQRWKLWDGSQVQKKWHTEQRHARAICWPQMPETMTQVLLLMRQFPLLLWRNNSFNSEETDIIDTELISHNASSTSCFPWTSLSQGLWYLVRSMD